MFKQTRLVAFLVVFPICLWMASSVANAKPELYLADNVLAAANYNSGVTSSDMTLIIRIEADGNIVLDEGTALGYIVPQERIRDWIEVDFDDSGWSGGVSGVGYGDSDDNTEIRSGNVASVYTRYYFDVPDARNIDELTFLVDYDDAYVLWLNGEEIARSATVGAIFPVGDEPIWNLGVGGHEASCVEAGKPNNARWNAGEIDTLNVSVDFGGQKPIGSRGESPQTAGPTGARLYDKNNIIAGANFNDGPGSSDMTLILRLLGDDEIYVDEGDDVKYIHDPDNADVPDSWIKVDFDDRDWEDGISGVGFSDGDDNTVTTTGLISIWTRYHFDVPEAAKIKELILLTDYDDAFIVWLNGAQIAFGGGPPTGDPPAWDAAQGGVGGHEAAGMAAGQPNKARWDNSDIQETIVGFTYGGRSALGVSARNKLPITWGNIKNQN